MPFDFLRPKQKQQQNKNLQEAQTNLGSSRYPNDILLGELMVRSGVITQQMLDDAVKLSASRHVQLGQMLQMAGKISPRDLQAAVDAQSMLRDRSIDQVIAAKCLKIACKTGMSFAEVYRDQIGQRTDASTNKLGELLLDAHLIDREQFGKAMQRSLATGLPLGRILVLNGAISENILTEALEIQVRIRDGMLERTEAVVALRASIGDFESEELQRQTMPFKAALVEPPRRKGVRLGELMVMAGLMSETDVMSALEIGLIQEQLIGQVFIAQGFINEERLDQALELQKKVEQGVLQPLEAGQALARISAQGVSVEESIESFVKPQEEAYEPLTFDKLLVLARVVSSEDIESAIEQVLQSPQLLSNVLILTNFIDEHMSSAILQCYSMLSNNFLSQDDAIIALDYCLHKQVERQISFGEALSELGWSATASLQIHAKNSVDVHEIHLKEMLEVDETVSSGEISAISQAEAEEAGRRAFQQALQGDQVEEPPPEAAEQPLEEAREPVDSRIAPQSVPDSQEITGETTAISDTAEAQIEILESAADQVAEAIAERLEETAEQLMAAAMDMENDIIENLPSPVESENTKKLSPSETAAEDAAFRKEFDLEAPDLTAQPDMSAAPPPEPDLANSVAAQAGGLLGLLGAQEIAAETTASAAAEKAAKDALGQVLSKTEFAKPSGEVGTTSVQNDALRDLFNPKNDGVFGGAGDENGKTKQPKVDTPAAPVPAQAALVAAPVEQVPVAATVTTEPLVVKSTPEVMAQPAAPVTTVPAPAPVEAKTPAPAGGLLASILAKGGSSAAELFNTQTNSQTPHVSSTADIAPLAVPSDRGANLQKPGEPEPIKPPVPQVIEPAPGQAPAAASANAPETMAPATVTPTAPPLQAAPVPAPVVQETVAPVAPPSAAPVVQETAAPPPAAPVVQAPVAPPPAAPVVQETAAPPPVAPVVQAPVAPPPAAPVVQAPVAPPPAAPVVQETVAPAAPPPAAPVVQATAAPPPAGTAAETTPAPAPAKKASAFAHLVASIKHDSAAKQDATVSAPTAAAPQAAPPVVPAAPPSAPPAATASADGGTNSGPGPAATPTPAAASVTAAPTPAAEPARTPATEAVPTPAAVPPASQIGTEAAEPLKEALGSALVRLAESYYGQGQYTEAQGLYEKILALKQQQLGPNDPSLGADLTNLAGVLCVQGKFAQAEPHVRKVVTIVETTEPVDSLKLAGSLNTLAGILFQQAKLEECEPLLARALALRTQMLGEEHPEVADSLRDYAKLLKKLGRLEEAEKYYQQYLQAKAKRQQVAAPTA